MTDKTAAMSEGKTDLRIPAVIFLFCFGGVLVGQGFAGFSLRLFLLATGALLSAACAGVLVRWIRNG